VFYRSEHSPAIVFLLLGAHFAQSSRIAVVVGSGRPTPPGGHIIIRQPRGLGNLVEQLANRFALEGVDKPFYFISIIEAYHGPTKGIELQKLVVAVFEHNQLIEQITDDTAVSICLLVQTVGHLLNPMDLGENLRLSPRVDPAVRREHRGDPACPKGERDA
jgi:hypothetical protein